MKFKKLLTMLDLSGMLTVYSYMVSSQWVCNGEEFSEPMFT
jgi:hypothetical protein